MFILCFCASFSFVIHLISFGIIGKSVKHFSCSTLIPRGEQKNNRDEAGSNITNSEDHLGVHGQGSRSTFMGPKSTGFARYCCTTNINSRNSAATTEVVTSDAEWVTCVKETMFEVWVYISVGRTEALHVLRLTNALLSRAQRPSNWIYSGSSWVLFLLFSCMPHFQKHLPGLSSQTPYLSGFASELKWVSYLPAGGAVE